MARFMERVSSAVSAFEASRWAWTTFQGATLLASFCVTAWAAAAAQIFSAYAPLSWVVAGFAGAFVWTMIRLLWSIAQRVRVRVRYDAAFLARGGNFNPLDLTFERKRIYLNPLVENKTFIDCDLIGPANIYLQFGNSVPSVREPKVDGVWLHPTAQFSNGFIFRNCIFRNCSFQRITMYAGIENYEQWKDNTFINWIGVAPTRELVAQRLKAIEAAAAVTAPAPATPKLLEHEAEAETEVEAAAEDDL